MKTVTQELAQYAAYHRDGRNLVSHFIGIPMIVLGVTILLSRPTALPSPAMVVATLLGLYYLWLDLRLGAAMVVLLALAVWAGHALAAQPNPVWLVSGLGLFVVGWIAQLVGHHYEGKRPAFLDDVIGLIIGPLFIVAELAFLAGLRPELREAVEAKAGPSRHATHA